MNTFFYIPPRCSPPQTFRHAHDRLNIISCPVPFVGDARDITAGRMANVASEGYEGLDSHVVIHDLSILLVCSFLK